MADRAALSVDFELFAQTPAYRSARGETDERDVGLEAVDFLLDALEAHDATATFFVVSSLAERHPEIVRSLGEAGHEIASHTHDHALLSTMNEGDRVAELERSREALEDVTSQSVTGFRAPAFDVPSTHFDDIAAAGFSYDSSVVPARSVPGWYGGEHDLRRPAPATRISPGASAGITEVPVSVMPGVRLPLTGAWLRFFGPRYTITGMRFLARRDVAPVLYVHPWELVDLPAVEGVPSRVYWRTGAWARRAVERILEQPFEFVSAGTVAEEAAGQEMSHERDATAPGDAAGDDPDRDRRVPEEG